MPRHPPLLRAQTPPPSLCPARRRLLELGRRRRLWVWLLPGWADSRAPHVSVGHRIKHAREAAATSSKVSTSTAETSVTVIPLFSSSSSSFSTT
eukprot:1091340-Rhodomonas_salina.1